MCIICNCGDAGDEFLAHFSRAQEEMRAAKKAMLKCSKVGTLTPEQRQQYDRAHKRMARILCDWNSVEHQREIVASGETFRIDGVVSGGIGNT